MLLCDEYLTPRSLEDAFDAMARNVGRFKLVAGATDLLPWAREGRAGDVTIPVLIDIARIPELTERRIEGGRVRIGAATVFQRFLTEPELVGALPEMPRCAVWFADDQIRESATIGGNLVNASPAADGIPPLLAHNAEVELAARRDGAIVRRRMALEDFVTGPGRTAIADDEILLAVACDDLTGYGGSFEKVGHRRSLVISTVCLAALVKLGADGRRFDDVRLAIGGIGPVARRLGDAERMLVGRPVTSELLQKAAALPADLIQSRTRRDYRRSVGSGFLMRGLINAIRAAGGDAPDLPAELEVAYA
ncbi:MAG TPA: FAD binding domain-containing protein [Hyphomicrobiales bacterium]|jgi:carbon-monoxide dehydrogenase medium subunit/xanthine dehydrogenase FAD-binding subunit